MEAKDNKKIFATNLKRYMDKNGKSRRDVCEALGFSYYTFSDWVNGKKYPRMDKVEMLANYFGILKSDLVEEKSEEREEMQKKSDARVSITNKMFDDPDFFYILSMLSTMDKAQILKARRVLDAAFDEFQDKVK